LYYLVYYSRKCIHCFISHWQEICVFLHTHLVGENIPFTLLSADAFLFHTPYCKLVQKSLARLMLNDFLSDANPDFSGMYAGLEKFR